MFSVADPTGDVVQRVTALLRILTDTGQLVGFQTIERITGSAGVHHVIVVGVAAASGTLGDGAACC